ncbi:MAG: hypothetical protein ACRDHY_00130, partial [Anaerolineales bacterium]
MSVDSFGSRAELRAGEKTYTYYRLDALKAAGPIDRLPVSLKILLENLVRLEDDRAVKREDIVALAN